VRLPLPTRTLPPAEMAKLRGAADSAALRLRHHSEAVHAARLPARREAKEVFDALEDVRVEAVGSRHMAGVAANLRARLSDACEAEGYDRMTRKDQLPLPAALSLLARERITGEKAPGAAHRVLDLWRDTLGAKADAASVSLRVSTATGLPTLELDQARMHQVIGNLLTNALRFTPAGGEIEVRAEAAGDGVEITIIDTGSGIAPDVLSRIFERFFRSGDSGGTGLGLPIARALVEAHRGTIEAASPTGGGTTVTIRLPFEEQESAAGT